MDNNTVVVIVVALFAFVAVVAFVLFRNKVKANIKGPGGTGLNIDASNPQPTPGAVIEGATSHEGGIHARDYLGRGATVRQAEARQDITATATRPEDNADPKA